MQPANPYEVQPVWTQQAAHLFFGAGVPPWSVLAQVEGTLEETLHAGASADSTVRY